MTTERAFKEVINRRDCHRRTGLSYSDISKYRKSNDALGGSGNYARTPTLDKMVDVLKKYGATKVIKEVWIV